MMLALRSSRDVADDLADAEEELCHRPYELVADLEMLSVVVPDSMPYFGYL